jgi:hypothetical protein
MMAFRSMRWRLKGVVQKALGYLPFGERLH